MTGRTALIGRARERAGIEAALEGCRAGHGGPVLVSGEAGAGKTRLIDEALGTWDSLVLTGTAVPGRTDAYGSVVQVLRAYLRSGSGGFAGDPLFDSLGALLPELGAPAHEVDQPTLVELVRRALRHIARQRPAVVVLEDLHWADGGTLDLLPALAASIEGERMLVIGSYRGDALPRDHPLRGARAEVRRTGRLTEIALAPLSEPETGQLVTELLQRPVSAELRDAVHARTDGMPFFVTELSAALVESGVVREGDGVLDLVPDAELPLPESVLDAVLVRTADLRHRHGTAVEFAAVLGVQVPLAALAGLVPPAEVDHLLDAGLLVEGDEGFAGFRHALVRDALYRAIPWGRRRARHRAAAERLAAGGAPAEEVAEHWIAAHEPEHARPLLLQAAVRYCAAHAYRDAARVARRALRIWPVDADPEERLATLERLAGCAELSGELPAAAQVWADVAALHAERGSAAAEAAARRRLANACDLLGDWPGAAAARDAAAAAFARAGQPAEAAAERLALADQLRSAAEQTRALEQAVMAVEAATQAGRVDLRARALALQGAIRAAVGEARLGVRLAREGLELALSEHLMEPAGEAYYELASALEYAADYAEAANAYQSAYDLCRDHGATEQAQVCFACMSPVLRLMGDWDRALGVCAEVLDADDTPLKLRMVAQEESGLITALRGDRRRARGPLRRAAGFARDHEVFGIEVGAIWGLALVADLDGDQRTAADQVATLLRRCRTKQEWHYALPALRWSATFLAGRQDRHGLAECHRLLAGVVARDTSPKVLSGLAHAGGELALLEGDAAEASGQFSRAVELLHGVTSPYERSLSQLRWGAALALAGDRGAAVEAVTSAYRIARQLRARPLQHSSAARLADMGEQVDRRLGRLAARSLQPAGLTRRELEVLRLLTLGQTNREIARELFVSPRTVDMHVRNALGKLGCTSRLAAARRATELGLVDSGR